MLTPFASPSLDTLTPHAHTCIQMQSFKIIISQLSMIIKTHTSFLSQACKTQEAQSRVVGLGHFEFKPPPNEELVHQVQELLFQVSGQFYAPCKNRAFQGPPRPSQRNCYALLIHGGKCPARTPKCDSRRSCAHKAIHSKSNFLVCKRERIARSQPRLVVSFGHISRLMVSQLVLTKQKQQANKHPKARYVSCKTTILRRNSHSVRIFSELS